MLVLGIDPGTALCGYGLVAEGRSGRFEAVEWGCVKTDSGLPMPVRLEAIYHALRAVVDRSRPDVVAIEELFFSRNVTSAIAVGQARGVALLVAAKAGLEVAEYPPHQVKQAVAGYGRAEKAQVQSMVKMILGLDEIPKPDDTADALAVALCCLQSWRLQRRLGV